ncbi:MAG: hypothetical protein KY468_14385 [Armatimonadetes bacterium]|nr:hypothetical protein [Armatimonadota bacterium]
MPDLRVNGVSPLVPAVLTLSLAIAGCQSNPGSPSATATGDANPSVELAATEAKAPATPAGPKAPGFTLKTVSGQTFQFSKQLKKGPVLVSFFNPL